MNDLECPYCGEKLDICHDDGFGYEEDIAHEMQCSNCEKNFVFYTSISFYYEPNKADCLNGEEHKYKPTTTVPTPYTRMRCEDCDEERALTDEERRILDIPIFKNPHVRIGGKEVKTVSCNITIEEKATMIIVFNGDTLDLEKRLQQYSGKDEKVTLDFMLENFKIMTDQDDETTKAIYNNEKAKADAAKQQERAE